MRVGGKGSSKCATSCSKGKALLVLEVADPAEVDPGVGEEDLAVAEDSVAVEEGLEVEGIGREAGRE